MRSLLLLLFFLTSFAAAGQHTTFQFFNSDSAAQQNSEEIQYSPAELMAFLDSVHALDMFETKAAIAKQAEETFKTLNPLDIELSDAEMEELKQTFTNDNVEFLGAWLSMKLAGRIFPYPIDTNAVKDSMLSVTLLPFGKSTFAFDEFAVCVGSPYYDANDIYFFKQNHVIAHLFNYNRYGLDLNFFKDTDGNTVVYYKENFGSGTGIWQFNHFFYKYNGNRLFPVLNLLENGNLNGWYTEREFWLETRIKKTKPLTFTFEYHFELADTNFVPVEIVKNSVNVIYKWNAVKQEFAGLFNSSFKEDELFAYYLSVSDLYCINVYYPHLKEIINGKNDVKKRVVLRYLNEVKNEMNK